MKLTHTTSVLLVLLIVVLAHVHTRPQGESFVIVGSQIADGSGKPLQNVKVRVVGDRIAEVGVFQVNTGERVINAAGLVLAPGFIDVHNHSDDGLEKDPSAVTQISQGVTTVLLGQDGISKPLRKAGVASLNIATCVGHATVREKVMGADYKRTATPDEILKMGKLVEQAMKEGAICLSSGLEFELGSFASTDEVVELAKVAARHGGFYISHIRDEADKTIEAMQELLSIGERAKIPVQNTHIKLGTLAAWGKAGEVLKTFDDARSRGVDVSADCYPYDAWMSNLKVLVPSQKWEDPSEVAKGLESVGGAQNVLIATFRPDRRYEGRTLLQVAASRSMTPVELYIEMVKQGDGGIIGKSMNEDDIKAFYQWPYTMVSSDGGIDLPHPRSAGSFTKVLGQFVRQKNWLTLPEAIRKMTSLPASRLKLEDRGLIKTGNVADLVLFNPATVRDNSTFNEPYKLSTGVEKVWVNGALVWDQNRATDARPGKVLGR